MKRKIGIYSGTFDPIHEGHIAFARESLKACHLDKVIFLPEASPRNKRNVSPIAQRVQAIKRSLGASPFYKVHTARSDRLTVATTMPEIMALYPEATIVLLVGSDIASSLHTWQNIDELSRSVQFAVGLRSDASGAEIDDIMAELGLMTGTGIRYTIVTTEYAAVSSSQKRAAAI